MRLPVPVRAQRGLGLVGLLVVVVILGAVSALVAVSVNRVTARSQRTVCTTDAQMIRTAVATDRARYRAGDVPTMEALVARGLLPRPSPYHAIAYSGATLVLSAIGACTGRNGS
jgi:Tfp pilus assembly protein PilE